MARIDVNLNEVSEVTREVHPDGPLHVRVKKATRSPQPGKSGYHYVLYQLDPVGTANRSQVFSRQSLSPDALPFHKEFLVALGVSWDSDGSFDADDTLGKECKVNITIGEYNGRPSNEVGPPYLPVA